MLFPTNGGFKLISIKVPEIKTPVYVRTGSSDVSSFCELFLDTDYPLPDSLSPKLIIDAGANVGYASLKLMNRYKSATMISIEPEESNFQVLTKNCELYSNYKGINKAIWINDDIVKITNPTSRNTGFRVERTTKDDKSGLSATTIQGILKNSGFDRIGILKLDIEGTEKELFENNYKKWIDKVDVLIIELHDRFKRGCALTFYSAIDSYDFVHYNSQRDNLIFIRKEILKANKT